MKQILAYLVLTLVCGYITYGIGNFTLFPNVDEQVAFAMALCSTSFMLFGVFGLIANIDGFIKSLKK